MAERSESTQVEFYLLTCGFVDVRGHETMTEDRRLEDLAPADFTEGSGLLRSLHHAVASVAELINLRRLGQGE